MIILRDIDSNKRRESQIFDTVNELLGLDEYIQLAQRCISKFAPPSLAAYMMNSEDAISHVAEHIMYGHCRWKENGGRVLGSYLGECAKWAIRIWKTKLYEASQREQYTSLDKNIGNGEGREKMYYEIVTDSKALTPHEVLFDNDSSDVKGFIESECLTDTQRRCLYGRFVEGKTLNDIATDFGVSRQAVDQNIKKAIGRLQQEYGTKEYISA